MTNLFKDKSKIEENNLFTSDKERFTPPIVPQEKALERAATLIVEQDDPDVLSSMTTIAEANVHNQQSTLELETINKDYQDRLEMLNQAASQAMFEDPSPETIDAYTEIQNQMKEAGNYDLKQNAVNKIIFKGESNKPVATVMEDYSVWLETNSHIAKIQAGLDDDLRDEGTASKYTSLATGFLGMILPQYYSGMMADVAKDFAPEEFERIHGNSIKMGLTINSELGTNRKLITEKILKAPMSERVQLVQQLADVVKTSRSGLFYDTLTQYFTKDGVNKKIVFEDILNRLKQGQVDGIDWDLVIGNTLGVIEMLPLFLIRGQKVLKTPTGPEPRPLIGKPTTPTPKGPVQGLKQLEDIIEKTPDDYFNAIQDNFKGSTITSYSDQMYMDPEMIAKILGTENQQVAAAYGLRVEDVLNRVLPKPELFNSTGMSSAAFSALDGDLVKLNSIISTINPKFALTAVEVEAAVDKQISASIQNITSAVRVDDGTKLAFRPDGFDVASVFGKNNARGYRTIGEVRATVASYGGNIEDIDIIHWNPQTSQYDIVKAEYIKKVGDHDNILGDFYIRTEEKYTYTDKTVMKLDEANFDGNRPLRVPNYVAAALGKVGGKQFTLPDKITLSASKMVDTQAALTKQISETVKPFLKANNTTKAKVQQALDDGNRNTDVFSKENFMTRYEATAKDFDVYAHMRLFYDALWHHRGTSLSKQFQAKGYRFITVTPESKTKALISTTGPIPDNASSLPATYFMGVPVETVPSHVKKVWDPVKGKSIAISEADTVYQLDQAHSAGGTNYNYINAGKATKVTGLPNNILKYEKGYVEIHYKDPYTIYHVYKRKVDGIEETYKAAVGSFPGEVAATKAIAAYNSVALNEGEVLKNFVVERRGPQTFTASGDNNQFTKWYQSREERMMRGIFGEDGPTPMVSVIESIERSIQNTAKTMSIGPWMDFNKQRYINTFGDDLTIPGEYSPPSKSLLNNVKDGKLAQGMYEHLELMGGFGIDEDNFITNFYKQGVLSLGSFMEGNVNLATGQWMQGKMADWTPTDFMRGSAFMLLVPTHPLRQLLQNPLTALWLSSVDPVIGGKAMIDAIGLTAALSTRRMGGPSHQATLSMYAKFLGTDVKTAEKTMEAFLNSGLISELDARQVYSSGIMNASNEVQSLARKVLGSPLDIFKKTGRGLKKVGFDAGEIMLMTQVSNFSMRNHARLTGKSLKEIINSQDDLDQVFAVARQMAGNQNKAGISVLQKKVPVVFNLLSFGIAQTLGMAFDSAASIAFKTLGVTKKKTDWIRSQPNQIKWVLGSMTLYGAAAFEPIIDGIESAVGEKIPEEVKKYIFFNAVDRGINGFLETVTGEKSEGKWSESINPAFMIPALAQMYRTFTGKTAMDFYLGATGGAKRRIDSMWEGLKMLSIDDTIEGPIANILVGADIVAEGLSKGYLDAKSWEAYIRQQAHFTDKYGNRVGDITLGNTIAKTFGVTLYAEAGKRRGRQSEKENKEDYKAISNAIYLYVQRSAKSGKWTQQTVDRITSIVNGLEHFDPVARDSINSHMAYRLGQSFEGKDPVMDSLNNWMDKNTYETRENIRDLIKSNRLDEVWNKELSSWLESTKGDKD